MATPLQSAFAIILQADYDQLLTCANDVRATIKKLSAYRTWSDQLLQQNNPYLPEQSPPASPFLTTWTATSRNLESLNETDALLAIQPESFGHANDGKLQTASDSTQWQKIPDKVIKRKASFLAIFKQQHDAILNCPPAPGGHDIREQDLYRRKIPERTRLIRQVLACRSFAEEFSTFCGWDIIYHLKNTGPGGFQTQLNRFVTQKRLKKKTKEFVRFGIKMLLLEHCAGLKTVSALLLYSSKAFRDIRYRDVPQLAISLYSIEAFEWKTKAHLEWYSNCITHYEGLVRQEGGASGNCSQPASHIGNVEQAMNGSHGFDMLLRAASATPQQTAYSEPTPATGSTAAAAAATYSDMSASTHTESLFLDITKYAQQDSPSEFNLNHFLQDFNDVESQLVEQSLRY